jgi:uncharacterized protein YjcR
VAAAGIDLVTLAQMYGIPYGTLARWAHEQNWPITRKRDRRLGLRQLYEFDPVAAYVDDRLAERPGGVRCAAASRSARLSRSSPS